MRFYRSRTRRREQDKGTISASDATQRMPRCSRPASNRSPWRGYPHSLTKRSHCGCVMITHSRCHRSQGSQQCSSLAKVKLNFRTSLTTWKSRESLGSQRSAAPTRKDGVQKPSSRPWMESSALRCLKTYAEPTTKYQWPKSCKFCTLRPKLSA